MATKLEGLQKSRANAVAKIAEYDEKIAAEKIKIEENKAKETEKLVKAQKAYEALYGKLDEDAWGNEAPTNGDNTDDEEEFEFSDEPSTPEPEYPTKKVKTKAGEIITVRLVDGKWIR